MVASTNCQNSSKEIELIHLRKMKIFRSINLHYG